MRVYKAGNKFIAIHTKDNTVYSAQGGSKEEAKNTVMEMIKKCMNKNFCNYGIKV